MTMFLWFGGGIAIVIAILVILFFILAARHAKNEAEKVARIEEDGEPVYCYVVFANDDLYKKKQTDDYSYAQVVYTFSRVTDLEVCLSEIAANLRDYKPPKIPTEEERLIGSVLSTHMPYFDPLRLPKKVAGNIEAYTVSVRVYWKKLPKGKLTRKYIWCKVLDGGQNDNVRMIDYPE